MSAIIFDTETTDIDEPVIVEAAVLEVLDVATCAPGQSWCGRFNPGKPISLGAMAVHHIMDEDLVDEAPASSFALPDGAEYLIGHNIDFDWKAIGSPDVKRICTLALSRHYWPDSDSHSLSAMLYLLERQSAREALRGAHSALTDVENCRVLLWHIVTKAGGAVDSWDALWRLSEIARVPTVMPFGKHKGMRIDQLPSDYAAWMLRQADIDPYLQKALRKAHR